MKTKDQIVTGQYAIYNSDCMEVLPALPANSIDLSIYSPPFAGLYNYSSSERDFSNCESKEQFLEQYEFMVEQIARVTKPGRITAVHCTDVFDNACRLWDFPNEIIRIHDRHGFQYRNRITIWKEPLKVRMRTMVKSLMHKLIVEDSTQCFTAMPDYVLVMTKKGDNAVPVVHPRGLTRYHGATPILPNILQAWNNANGASLNADELWEHLKTTYADHNDPKSNKLSHYIWQRYASSVWDDIRIDNVLPFRDSKEEDDEKHVHALQLDVIDRLVELYSNEGETVLTPFMGVGSEVYSPVSLGRKAIGIELKDSYFKQSKINVALAGQRFDGEGFTQDALFAPDEPEELSEAA
ncbi:site-specific DNA-methyltransferase [Hydrogenophaga aromaticivorans]|uniref:DNA-methyltransferase n=1 Tax=Hydrogenophaga aromaticivorans TaxID=2610898 RepID=UPI001B35D8BE|nr:DNA methyltransferase [Hydrogenophaga aromaticivorans]MBQ0917471.1 site-specific DNA-methyltransferase [Hydrogenophaga aromaticivorans]